MNLRIGAILSNQQNRPESHAQRGDICKVMATVNNTHRTLLSARPNTYARLYILFSYKNINLNYF